MLDLLGGVLGPLHHQEHPQQPHQPPGGGGQERPLPGTTTPGVGGGAGGVLGADVTPTTNFYLLPRDAVSDSFKKEVSGDNRDGGGLQGGGGRC